MTSTTSADSAAGAAGAGGNGRAAPPRGRVRARLSARSLGQAALVAAFWLAVWQVAAVAVGQELLLITPAGVVVRLAELVVTGDFWATVAYSLVRIGAGFAAAVVVGSLGAALAARSRVVRALAAPLVVSVRTTPVVSFIILVLIWASSSQLAMIIAFLMVVPILYTTVLEGIDQRDVALLEAAAVFDVPFWRRVTAVDLPAVLPYLIAGCRVGVGLAWKSGVAAEVIGITQGSIGERLYEAKILLSTADLFAWTLVIVAVSYGFERVVVLSLTRAQLRLARGRSA